MANVQQGCTQHVFFHDVGLQTKTSPAEVHAKYPYPLKSGAPKKPAKLPTAWMIMGTDRNIAARNDPERSLETTSFFWGKLVRVITFMNPGTICAAAPMRPGISSKPSESNPDQQRSADRYPYPLKSKNSCMLPAASTAMKATRNLAVRRNPERRMEATRAHPRPLPRPRTCPGCQ